MLSQKTPPPKAELVVEAYLSTLNEYLNRNLSHR